MVEIAAGLRRAARRTEGSLDALVRSTGSVELTAEAVRQAVRAAAVSDDEIDRATPLEIQETSKGPAVVLTDADPDDMLPVLERLAERLAEAGLTDATLTVLPRRTRGGVMPSVRWQQSRLGWCCVVSDQMGGLVGRAGRWSARTGIPATRMSTRRWSN